MKNKYIIGALLVGINQTAAMEASSHIVVAWFLPCDFGGSHAYVCQQPERICAPYRRK